MESALIYLLTPVRDYADYDTFPPIRTPKRRVLQGAEIRYVLDNPVFITSEGRLQERIATHLSIVLVNRTSFSLYIVITMKSSVFRPSIAGRNV